MRAAIKWGVVVGIASYLLLGLGLTLLGVAVFGTAPPRSIRPGKLTLGCGSIFLLLFAVSAAGFFTGRETLNAGMGALAGMVTFAIYGVLITIYAPGALPICITQDTSRSGWFCAAGDGASLLP